MNSNQFQQAFLNSVKPADADALLVGMTANAIEIRLAVKSAAGKEGWHRSETTVEQLRAKLGALVANNGNAVDIAILAGMIHVKEAL